MYVRHECVPNLNPEDKQAVLLTTAVVPEKVEGTEDNDGNKAGPLLQRMSFALYPDVVANAKPATTPTLTTLSPSTHATLMCAATLPLVALSGVWVPFGVLLGVPRLSGWLEGGGDMWGRWGGGGGGGG
ncbi:hypothetical protein B0H13DRAFT_1931649 [Mycena leptocephala]|nr:hypothetical protein B0H13DRAFT_1931649 [Mycena leptocephala]